MFDDIDDALRKLLLREIPVRGNEVEIAFDHPKREWSARLNRPTINIFLHDVRENVDFRGSHQRFVQPNGDSRTATIPRPLHWVDLHYLITAWASEPDDEHRLLARTLIALMRTPQLPADLMVGALAQQPSPIKVQVARQDSPYNPPDLWGVLDNELRPSLNCSVTLAVDPHVPAVVPVVRIRELRVGELSDLSFRRQRGQGGRPIPVSGRGQERAAELQQEELRAEQESTLSEFWTVGGQIRSAGDAQSVRVILLETGIEIPVTADGRFVIGHLRAGIYTLAVTVDGQQVEHKLVVPSENYLDLDA
jgi:hypothetical protein